MATESSSSRSSSAADSYVGSLISLISKSEIRYEGILYNINTEESSIGLQNVRSFGTEGRKKDGPQVPPSDNVYEYILFRGSDIKDLQVKSSPLAQPTVPNHNDPAIIQSHYPSPSSAPSTTLSSSVSKPSPDISTQSAQAPLPSSNFQGSYPLYQPGGTMSWGAPPPTNANGSGLNMPMYWQGYYGAPNGLLQHSLLQPPPMPSMQQPMHYPFNANMSAGVEAPTTSVPAATSSSISMNTSFLTPPLMPSVPLAAVPSETTSSSLPDKAPTSALPSANVSSRAPPTSRTIGPLISSKPSVSGGATLPYQSTAQSASSLVGTSDSVRGQASSQAPTLPLVTPSQLLPSVSTTVPVSQSPQSDHKDAEVIKVPSSPPLNVSSPPVGREVQPPILPLPLPSPARTNYKPNGGPPSHNHQGYRGRERGRGSGPSSRAVTKFTEDFDFTAMNEKFNKDEVWGHLGKNIKDTETEGDPNIVNDDADDYGYEEDTDVPKVESKTVYNKDDFFDSLSCDALNRGPHNGRTRFSEQVKIDTETFGDISRQWGGGRGPGRGGWGRGGRYNGRGYGYGGRGRGRGQGTYYNRAS